MVSIADNLSFKLSWMSHQLKWINDAPAIQEWINTMHSVQTLLLSITKTNLNWQASTQSTQKGFNSHCRKKSLTISQPWVINSEEALLPTKPVEVVKNKKSRKDSPTEISMEENYDSNAMEFQKDNSEPMLLPENITIAKVRCCDGPRLPPRVELEEEEPPRKKIKTLPNLVHQESFPKNLVPGAHFWYGKNKTWAFHQFSCSDKYEILQQKDPDNILTVKRLKTGKTYKTKLLESLRLKLET